MAPFKSSWPPPYMSCQGGAAPREATYFIQRSCHTRKALIYTEEGGGGSSLSKILLLSSSFSLTSPLTSVNVHRCPAVNIQQQRVIPWVLSLRQQVTLSRLDAFHWAVLPDDTPLYWWICWWLDAAADQAALLQRPSSFSFYLFCHLV